MEPINMESVQGKLDSFVNKEVYVHIETTNGAYASHFDSQSFNVGAYVRNASVMYNQAKIVPDDQGRAHRVGLKLEKGWIYAEGLTDWTMHESQLLMAGHDNDGRLMVAMEISENPFDY